ncbi:uncharacterized protein LOC112686069 [Sipha flava]|uniref:Uncharacterized protein LOC112686069 n=2 Tax=Sipha flava TaxID=143950 RepID=A0A8B8FT63_9HEMI|nr:uncharacterized protein LOC112686069 [Sipha flava]
MRAASTGGGLVRLVVIWLVVLAALVMTAAGASSTSAAATVVTATATATAAAAAAAAAAAHKTATPPTAMSEPGGGNVTAGRAPCELVRVSLRKPACTGQISEGPGPPPPPPPRCPSCTRRSDNNNNYNNKNNKNNNNNINSNNNNYNNYNNNNNNKINNNNNNSNHECLEYARRELIPEMCPDDPTAYRSRPGRLSRYRLRHCCHHTVESVAQQPYGDRQSCYDRVNEALDLDDVAAAMSCQFDEVLARYDCNQMYSAKSCESCKDAYALWACAAVLPHWTRSTDEQGRHYRVNACQSVCLEAEQKCPWLLPVADDANPYAGEAAFTCIDPDIGYQMSSTNAPEDCCYEHCAEHRLCVRNSTACDRGDGRADQRPLCVEEVPLTVEESECTDFGPTGSSAATRPPTVTPPLLVALLLLLLLLATCAGTAAAAPTAAVT